MRRILITLSFPLALFLLCLYLPSSTLNTSTSPTTTSTTTKPISANPPKLLGLTFDNVANLPALLTLTKSLPYRPTIRLVLDPKTKPASYLPALQALHPYADLMLTPLDSSETSTTSLASITTSTSKALSILSPYLTILEVGNEINGEWTGSQSDVISKTEALNNLAASYHLKTALTLYYNHGCSDSTHDLLNYLPTLPKDLLQPDYAFLSWYPTQCDVHPDWNQTFDTLETYFPNSALGFGELGLPNPVSSNTLPSATYLVTSYYSLSIANPHYVGGLFWWYAAQDMTNDKPLSRTLLTTLGAP